MVNSISLAEVCRSRGDIERAEGILNNVERICNLPEVEKEYYVGGQWLWNFLPEHEGDADSPRYTITCGTFEQKRAVLRISQGLLAAAKGDGQEAARRFDECLKLEPLYKSFLVNKLRAAAYADKLDDRIRTILQEAAEVLESQP
jgi:lipopolysaccharide biosynthesis regulator YciM